MRTVSRFPFPYLALAATGCVAAWSLQKTSHELHRTLEQAGIALPNAFAIAMDYGLLLYVIPIALGCIHFASSRVSMLREPLVMELVATAMVLLYISTSFLLM